MIRGCQRQMVVLETLESALFERAYFVLRRTRYATRGEEMVREAERLLGEGSVYVTRRRKRRSLLLFFLGALAGATLGVGIFALFHALLQF